MTLNDKRNINIISFLVSSCIRLIKIAFFFTKDKFSKVKTTYCNSTLKKEKSKLNKQNKKTTGNNDTLKRSSLLETPLKERKSRKKGRDKDILGVLRDHITELD